MEVQILGDVKTWRQAVGDLPEHCHDIYFAPEYHQLSGIETKTQPYCAKVTEKSESLVIPGLRVPISDVGSSDQGRWDIQSCYGYGGPLVSANASSDFLGSAWDEWRRWSKEKGVVAAFFRLHPILNNSAWLPTAAKVVMDRQTVFVDLSRGIQAAWAKADSRHRNMVSRGRKEGAIVAWDDPQGWSDFERLYRDAMVRLNATSELHFSPSYFAGLRSLPGVQLACVRQDGILTAAAVFIFGERWAHYHLSARRANAGNFQTNCLLQSGLERAAQLELDGLHLGGGRTAAADDTLLAFKCSLGGQLLDFKVALVIIDTEAYQVLCQSWEKQNGTKPSWLLGYRQGR